jgi:dTDP-L-rhamnose 4-epimerase
MVVYGEGSYRCPEHGERSPALRPRGQLERREWEPLCTVCARELTPIETKEDAPLRPASVYGITKRDQEELVLVLGRAYGLATIALRYLNAYGTRQALGNPYTGVAAIFAARILNGRPPLVFEDGRQIRDLVHVSDVVRGTLAAMDAPDAPGHAINIGTGRQIRVADLARRLARSLDSELEPTVTGEFRAGDIRHCFADTRRARELLGFEASRSLEDGLPELTEWVARQQVVERADAAIAGLRERGLVG